MKKKVDESQVICKKREIRKQRKINIVKSKSVTIGENERKQVVNEIKKITLNEENNNNKKGGKKKYSGSSSDLTLTQYNTMKNKFKEMQLPLIKWLTDHVKIEKIDSISSDDSSNNNSSSTLKISDLETVIEATCDNNTTIRDQLVNSKKPGTLSVTIPHQSIYQLGESEIITPESFAVQRLEKISKEIMSTYGGMLADHIKSLLKPIRETNSIKYDTFSCVTRKVYDLASGEVMSKVALVLNMVRETMIVGNLNESLLEMLVEHSTTFLTTIAPQSLIERGSWDTNEPNFVFPDHEDNIQDGTTIMNCEENETEWAQFGFAVVTVGIGLAFFHKH